jgi:hypothetical protein
VFPFHAVAQDVADSVVDGADEKSRSFTRAELKELFELQEDTVCNTYDLLSRVTEEDKVCIACVCTWMAHMPVHSHSTFAFYRR